MKVSQKKTCGGCRAYVSANLSSASCALGYSNKAVYKEVLGVRMSLHAVPLEPCPKPVSIKDSFDAPHKQ
jgi:hypothetical protein